MKKDLFGFLLLATSLITSTLGLETVQQYLGTVSPKCESLNSNTCKQSQLRCPAPPPWIFGSGITDDPNADKDNFCPTLQCVDRQKFKIRTDNNQRIRCYGSCPLFCNPVNSISCPLGEDPITTCDLGNECVAKVPGCQGHCHETCIAPEISCPTAPVDGTNCPGPDECTTPCPSTGQCPTVVCPEGKQLCGTGCDATCEPENDATGCPLACPTECAATEMQCSRHTASGDGCSENYCEPERTDGCPTVCTERSCPGGEKTCRFYDATTGCPDFSCVKINTTNPTDPDKPECQAQCHPECDLSTHKLCPAGNDDCGCPLQDICIEKKYDPDGTECTDNYCPLPCGENEAYCPGPKAADGCPIRGHCEKQNPNYPLCKPYCPARCDENLEYMCPPDGEDDDGTDRKKRAVDTGNGIDTQTAWYDDHGCKQPGICLKKIQLSGDLECEKICPMKCGPGKRACPIGTLGCPWADQECYPIHLTCPFNSDNVDDINSWPQFDSGPVPYNARETNSDEATTMTP